MTLKDLENKRKRLIYRSWHRGTREMDLILGPFADKNVPGFLEEELGLYEELLSESDPDLYGWVTGKENSAVNSRNSVLERLQKSFGTI